MGAGKTTLAVDLSVLYNINHIDLDHEIELSVGMSIPLFFEIYGESEFRKIEHKMLLSCEGTNDVVISTGGGTPCFYDNMDLMNDFGVTVYLKRSVQYLHNILMNDDTRPLLNGLNQEELMQFIKDSLYSREKYYNQSVVIVDDDELSSYRVKHILDKYIL